LDLRSLVILSRAPAPQQRQMWTSVCMSVLDSSGGCDPPEYWGRLCSRRRRCQRCTGGGDASRLHQRVSISGPESRNSFPLDASCDAGHTVLARTRDVGPLSRRVWNSREGGRGSRCGGSDRGNNSTIPQLYSLTRSLRQVGLQTIVNGEMVARVEERQETWPWKRIFDCRRVSP